MESMLRAFETGDIQQLLDVLAPDVVLTSDGGGVVQAGRRPVVGAGKVARYLVGGAGKISLPVAMEVTVFNGSPALLVRLDGEVDGVMAARLDGDRIAGLYYVRNPAKLTHATSATPLTLP
jgi:RNA polymerase sigma-70 factor (ECF subfamily)